MNARDARVVELVCEACGYSVCAKGVLLCPDARRSGVCTREEYERRYVEEQRRREMVA